MYRPEKGKIILTHADGKPYGEEGGESTGLDLRKSCTEVLSIS